MRILIICHYYPPLHSIASLRPYAYAKYWSEMGHAVTVLTTVKPPQGSLLLAANVNVEEQPYWGSKFISAAKTGLPSGRMALDEDVEKVSPSTLKKIVLWLRRKYGILAAERIPEMIFAWFFSGRRYIERHIKEYDVVLAQYSPPTALILGAYAKRLAGKNIKLVMDYRDSWTVSNYSQPGLPGVRWLEKVVESRLIKYADLISCSQAGIANEFIERGISNVAVIENGFFDDIPEADDLNISAGINLVYTGSFGGYRDIDFLQGALEIIKDKSPEIYEKINIFILGEGETSCNHSKIKILGKVDYARSLLYQKNSTILLIVESSRDIAKYNIPGKFFEYFRYKKPIIAFGPQESFEIARYLKKNKIGIVSKASAQEAAIAILHVLANLSLYEGEDLNLFSRKSKAIELLALINRI